MPVDELDIQDLEGRVTENRMLLEELRGAQQRVESICITLGIGVGALIIWGLSTSL